MVAAALGTRTPTTSPSFDAHRVLAVRQNQSPMEQRPAPHSAAMSKTGPRPCLLRYSVPALARSITGRSAAIRIPSPAENGAELALHYGVSKVTWTFDTPGNVDHPPPCWPVALRWSTTAGVAIGMYT